MSSNKRYFVIHEEVAPRHSGNFIAHYGRSVDDGAPIGSGRYRKGSGEKYKKNTYQSLVRFREFVERERDSGKTDAQIRASMDHMSKKMFDARIQLSQDAIAKNTAKIARKMHDQGTSKREIARRLSVSDGTIRNYLKPDYMDRFDNSGSLVDKLKKNVDSLGYVDVGKGVAAIMGCSKDDLGKAVATLTEMGYKLYSGKGQKGERLSVKQLTTGNDTPMAVLVKEGVTKGEVVRAILDAKVRLPSPTPEVKMKDGVVQDPDGNYISDTPFKPASVDSSRILIRYAEEGGLDKDGLIEVRRTAPDLDMGKAHYAQVRIAVDDKLYIKGMAVPSDDIPEGYDIVVNSNKPQGSPLDKVLKPMKDDPANPFGASIKPEEKLIRCQKYYTDPVTGEKKLSAINVVNEEGDWDTWNKALSSQFLFKQPLALIKEQLSKAYESKAGEFEEIMSLTNPTVKKLMLNDFADSCQTAQWKMSGAPIAGQSTQVLLPLTTLKEYDPKDKGGVVGEVYAPAYPDGQELVLCRFPMADISELPRVINNLSNKEGQKLIGTSSIEAIGVSPGVRQQMSGADNDGDTCIAMPDNVDGVRRIDTRKMYDEMKDFDPAQFARKETDVPTKDRTKKNGYRGKDEWDKGFEMGSVSNLIMDMNAANAPESERIRAMKHSMVVIDAEKHNYDWQASEKEFGIKELKIKYQGGPDAGAATIVSRRKRDVTIKERKQGVEMYNPVTGKKRILYYDPETGEKLYTDTGRTYKEGKYKTDDEGRFVRNEDGKKVWEETGKVKEAKSKVKLLNYVDDAFEVTSGGSKENPGSSKEAAYAENANRYKDLEKRARAEFIKIQDNYVDNEAKAKYAVEVASITAKINTAEKNAPYERQAQMLAGKMYNQNQENYDTPDDEKKGKAKMTTRAREIVGSKPYRIELTPREVEAINANAVTKTKIEDMYKRSNKSKLKEAFMPADKPKLSESRISLARQMYNNGVSLLDIAAQFDVSASTVLRALQ